MACTTLLVGKKASYDGSTLVARTEDCGAGKFAAKKFAVVLPEDQPRVYKSVISKAEITLPDHPMRYTAMPNAVDGEGVWGAAGVNAQNVAMTATETITSNERVLSADPMVEGGIGEEDMVTLVLPYIRSAREGVLRLGALLAAHGTYEKNGIAFHDENEIWWLETIGGHHFIAKRVPDDAYVVMPNQLGIDTFDLEDAFGAQRDHLCSEDLKAFIAENHLDLSLDGPFNPRDAFGSHSDSDHTYNTPRAWVMERYFNPSTNRWDGEYADYTPASDDIPWSNVPERKITIEDVKYVLSHHYQGTPYDVYARRDARPPFRPIGINRNNVLVLTQIRPYMPDAVKALEWIAYGSSTFNALIPFYANIGRVPSYLGNATARVTTENLYWVNRIIAALADAHFHENIAHIERYQMAVQSEGHALIKRYDREALDKGLAYQDASVLLEKANDEIATMAQKHTDDLLDKVLFTTSLMMRNAFSRSDG